MTEDYTCPKQGCDYGEDESKSLAAVRGHINAAAGHDWTELKPALYDQAESSSGSGESESEEGGEPDADESESESESDKDDDEMPTQDEYREQYEEQNSDEDGESGAESASSETGGVDLPISPTMVVALLGAAVVLFLAYRALSGDDQAGDADPETVDATTDVDEADDESEMERGLV